MSSQILQALNKHKVDTRLGPIDGSTESKIMWILEQVRASQPDVFVANLCVPALYAAGWIREAGIPTVGVLHSDDTFYRQVQDEFVFGDSFFSLTAVVVVSRFLEESVKRRKPSQTLVFRAPYGVPVPDRPVTPPGQDLRMIYVGRLVEPQKRIYRVVRAMCAAAGQLPGVQGSIVGSGRKREGVLQILAEECPGQTVQLVGQVPLELMPRTLLGHHVFVLLSEFEGLPIALMEAMACGLVPVVTEMRSGVPELIKHEVNGLIVGEDAVSFVAAIERLRNEPRLWEKLSRNARVTVQSQYSEEASGKTWTELLIKLARQRCAVADLQIPDRPRLPKRKRVFAHEDVRERTTLVERVEAALFGSYEVMKRLVR